MTSVEERNDVDLGFFSWEKGLKYSAALQALRTDLLQHAKHTNEPLSNPTTIMNLLHKILSPAMRGYAAFAVSLSLLANKAGSCFEVPDLCHVSC